MAKETKQEKGVRILEARGYREKPCKSRKYRALAHPDKPERLYFIGKRGAIRCGKNVSSSISVGKVK